MNALHRTNPARREVSKFWYRWQGNNIEKPEQRGAPASILPVLSRLDAWADAAITLAQSPYDTPIVACVQATPAAINATSTSTANTGGWLKWTRQYYRPGGAGGGAHEALAINSSPDLIAHASCWRPGVSWLQTRYATFFEPKATAATLPASVFETASCADSRGLCDKKTGYMMNWDSSTRFQ